MKSSEPAVATTRPQAASVPPDTTRDQRSRHLRTIAVTVAAFLALQALAGALGTLREFQYYARIVLLIEINVILTASLALINGFTGQFSLGHAGFMAIGAYGSVVVTTVLPRLLGGSAAGVGTPGGHLLFIVSVIVGAVLAGIVGLAIGFPSLRLRGDYLAIVTLAAGEVIRALLRYSDFVGGPRGIPGIPKFANAVYIGAAMVACIWLIRNFVYSHYGRVCIAVRNDEVAAQCMGVNTTYVKVLAFVLGACFAGVGGALFAHMSQYVNPDNFSILKSLDILIFLYVGGSRTLSGAIVGAAIFTVVPELLRFAHLESWRMVVYPVILILVIRFRQEGIMGERELGFLVPWKHRLMKAGRGLR